MYRRNARAAPTWLMRKLPHCVDLCATGAFAFGDEEEFADELLHAETYLLGQAAGLLPQPALSLVRQCGIQPATRSWRVPASRA
ncbi:MAG: hypothetical protein V8S24_04275 [Gordonibacter pamelaeae]